MANKTRENDASVADYIAAIDDDARRADAIELSKMMAKLSGEPPKMWGTSIVGFGKYQYKYESGREGEHLRTGFASRKTALTLYIMLGFGSYDDLMGNLGKFKTGRSCLYIKKLDDIDRDVLKKLIKGSLDYMAKTYPE